MASIRRFPGSRYWFACFIGPDGRRTQRSTKETDKGRAQKIADRYAEAARLGRMGLLADRQARKVIGDIYQISNRAVLRDETIRGYFTGWLERKERETTNATFRRYSGIVTEFLKWLGSRAELGLTHLSSAENRKVSRLACKEIFAGECQRGPSLYSSGAVRCIQKWSCRC